MIGGQENDMTEQQPAPAMGLWSAIQELILAWGDRTGHPPPPVPEINLLAAVIVQAVVDAPKRDGDGRTARAFLDHPDVQDLAEALWGVRTRGDLDPRLAAEAIQAYRLHYGRLRTHQRRQRKASDRVLSKRV
jgi:hypothetical protein